MRLMFTALLAVVLAVGGAWYLGLVNPTKLFDPSAAVDPTKPETPEPVELGDFLYPPVPDPTEVEVPHFPTYKADPVVIPGLLVVWDKQKVPSPRDGILLFVGQELTNENPAKPLKPGSYEIANITLGEKDIVTKAFQRWNEDDIVKPDQMLALVNPALAMKEFQINLAKLEIAKAEHIAAGKAKSEALSQYQRAEKLYGKVVGAEELSIKKFYYEKEVAEEQVKAEGINAAKNEADKAQIVYEQHIIKNKTLKGTAVIKHLFKKGGESIKAYEDIMELHNIEMLRADGTIGSEYQKRLKTGMKVTLEPVHEDAPRKLSGHVREITSVAFGTGPNNMVLLTSASADYTVRVWHNDSKPLKCIWRHPTEVTAVACSPATPEGSWCLSGCHDGSVRLWDLNKLNSKEPPKWEKTTPGGAGLTALAFSPDGKYFATGGEDTAIRVWQTDTGELLYAITGDVHQGTITSLNFTPQCRLVSAAKDGTLRVWELHKSGAKAYFPAIANRSGTVGMLGVSRDGRWMLFDKGKELQLLSVADGHIKGLLQNPMSTMFESLTLLSPDANSSLILTAGAPEGRLQLWKAPIGGARPFEVRQWVPKEHSAATCAAFAPNAGGPMPSLAASGCKDGYVYLWSVPGQGEVENQPIKNLTLDTVAQAIESGTQIRVGVMVPNPVNDEFPRGKLSPGGSVTIVVE